MDAIKNIYNFQEKAGLIEKGYDDFLESSFQIEEALEGFDLNSFEDINIGFKPLSNPDAKEVSRKIVEVAQNYGNESISNVDRLDKACDAIVFAVGSMAKLGLSPEQINQALNIVNNANMQKIGCEKDEHGKLKKPDNFINPEDELQKILDENK